MKKAHINVGFFGFKVVFITDGVFKGGLSWATWKYMHWCIDCISIHA